MFREISSVVTDPLIWILLEMVKQLYGEPQVNMFHVRCLLNLNASWSVHVEPGRSAWPYFRGSFKRKSAAFFFYVKFVHP